MPWLVKEGKVLASVEMARPRRGPLRGSIGREPITGAIMFEPARAAHSIRSDRALDFAFLGLVSGDDSDAALDHDADDRPPLSVSSGSSSVEAAVVAGKAKSKQALGKAKSVSKALTNARVDAAAAGEDREYRVLRVVTLEPNRIVKPELRAVAAVEAEVGAFERWGLVVGDTVRIEVRQ